MRWQKPQMTVVKMDAEIGSYQADDANDPPFPGVFPLRPKPCSLGAVSCASLLDS